MARQVSNSGVVLRSGAISIGIDIFSNDASGIYPATPLLQKQMLLEEIETNRLSVLLFTHDHDDHFDRQTVKEAWMRNPALKIVSTETVIGQLRQEGISGENLISVPEKLTGPGMEFGGFRIWPFYSCHAGKQYSDVQNLTFLIGTDNQHYVFPGDAEPRAVFFDRIQDWEQEIDWFFLPFTYVGRPTVRRMMDERLIIHNIWVLHCLRPEADRHSWVKRAQEICKGAADSLPYPIFGEIGGGWISLQ